MFFTANRGAQITAGDNNIMQNDARPGQKCADMWPSVPLVRGWFSGFGLRLIVPFKRSLISKLWPHITLVMISSWITRIHFMHVVWIGWPSEGRSPPTKNQD